MVDNKAGGGDQFFMNKTHIHELTANPTHSPERLPHLSTNASWQYGCPHAPHPVKCSKGKRTLIQKIKYPKGDLESDCLDSNSSANTYGLYDTG